MFFVVVWGTKHQLPPQNNSSESKYAIIYYFLRWIWLTNQSENLCLLTTLQTNGKTVTIGNDVIWILISLFFRLLQHACDYRINSIIRIISIIRIDSIIRMNPSNSMNHFFRIDFTIRINSFIRINPPIRINSFIQINSTISQTRLFK